MAILNYIGVKRNFRVIIFLEMYSSKTLKRTATRDNGEVGVGAESDSLVGQSRDCE